MNSIWTKFRHAARETKTISYRHIFCAPFVRIFIGRWLTHIPGPDGELQQESGHVTAKYSTVSELQSLFENSSNSSLRHTTLCNRNGSRRQREQYPSLASGYSKTYQNCRICKARVSSGVRLRKFSGSTRVPGFPCSVPVCQNSAHQPPKETGSDPV